MAAELSVGETVRFKHISFNVKKQYPFTGVRPPATLPPVHLPPS